MDDEKYFTYPGNNMSENAGYYSNDKSTRSDNPIYYLIMKKCRFYKKLLVN